jgi:hypothetical protein
MYILGVCMYTMCVHVIRDSATGWKSGFRFPVGVAIFLFSTPSRPALGLIQPPIQCLPEAISLGLKRQGREADDSLVPIFGFKNAWSYTSTPYLSLRTNSDTDFTFVRLYTCFLMCVCVILRAEN